jgi:membrane-bound ClpP family serine protease
MAGMRRKRAPVGLIVVGCALVAVGISSGTTGFLGAGIVFIIVGAAVAVRSRRGRDGNAD